MTTVAPRLMPVTFVGLANYCPPSKGGDNRGGLKKCVQKYLLEQAKRSSRP